MKHFYQFVISLCYVVTLIQAKWSLKWSDEFNYNGGVDTSKWDFDEGGHGWGNNEKQFYTRNRRENARCELFSGSSNGRLIIEARKENYANNRYTSARLKSKISSTYGRLQIRAQLPTGRGLWPALWLLPSSTTYSNKYWPDNGEIDLMEQIGYEPTRIHSSVHTQANNHMSNNQPTNSVSVHDATLRFKVYTLQWDADRLQMFVGDEANPEKTRILVWNKKGDWKTWPFDKPFFVLMNIAVGGNWGGSRGIDDGIFPRRMEIDWIRYYQWR